MKGLRAYLEDRAEKVFVRAEEVACPKTFRIHDRSHADTTIECIEVLFCLRKLRRALR